MINISYQQQINASPETVWKVLTHLEDYKLWVKPFSENSKFLGEWIEGSEMVFIDENHGGTVALLEDCKARHTIHMKHIATINKEGIRETTGEMTEKWVGTLENYTLSQAEQGVLLKIDLYIDSSFKKMCDDAWPQCLLNIKELSEVQKTT